MKFKIKKKVDLPPTGARPCLVYCPKRGDEWILNEVKRLARKNNLNVNEFMRSMLTHCLRDVGVTEPK